MKIELQDLFKYYGTTAAVDNVTLSIADGELLSLLGPSGCGKTTLLRMIAGLIPVSSGKILFGGREITSVPTQKRNAAMVFQNYALFPNLTVAENIAFGLKARRVSRSESRSKTQRILKSVELEDYGNRRIQELSGGQKQRVALARALVIEPDILLLDEPLSNLDQKLRVSMRQTIRALQREFGITSIYVTHDQEEAMAISDRIAVMDHGKLQQVDLPQQLYSHPRNAFVADFIGKANLLRRKTEQSAAGRRISLLGRSISVPETFSAAESVLVLLRPENLWFSQDGEDATVFYREVLGLITRYQIQTTRERLVVDVVSQPGVPLYREGDRVTVSFAPESLCFLPDEGGGRH